MITLPAALLSQLTIGGAVIETDATAACSSLSIEYSTRIVSFTIRQGSTAGQVFTAGAYPPSYTFKINLITGAWTVDGSALNGTLSGAGLTSTQTTFLNLKNTAESFAVGQNLFPAATTTAWTSL